MSSDGHAPGSPEEERAIVALQECRTAGFAQQWAAAIAAGQRGLACKSGDVETKALLHFYLGTAYMRADDLGPAEDHLSKGANLAAGHACINRLLGNFCYNLAYVYRARKRFRKELPLLKRAAQAYQAEGQHDRVLVCQYEMIWGALRAGRYDQHVLSELQELRARCTDPELGVDILVAIALWYRLEGDFRESQRLCVHLRENEELPARQIAEVEDIAAGNYEGLGDREEARRCINKAYAAAVAEWWPPQLERIDEHKKKLDK